MLDKEKIRLKKYKEEFYVEKIEKKVLRKSFRDLRFFI